MKRVISMAGVLVLVMMASAAFAQSKPNFAGKWTLVPDPNAAAGGGRGRGGLGMGNEFTAAQDEKTLTVTRANQQIGEIKSVYNLDGSDSKNTLSFGGQSVDQMSKVKWDGSKLVITTKTNFQGNEAESTQTWSLDASGSLMIESTSNFGGNGPTTTKSTYKKS